MCGGFLLFTVGMGTLIILFALIGFSALCWLAWEDRMRNEFGPEEVPDWVKTYLDDLEDL